jgi:SAM-dependent methyltransferase
MPAMPSNQELFEKGLATYRRVEAANYMAHREVYELLHDVLVAEAPESFVFADLGCGTATGSAKALAGTKIGRYVGVDISGRHLMWLGRRSETPLSSRTPSPGLP